MSIPDTPFHRDHTNDRANNIYRAKTSFKIAALLQDDVIHPQRGRYTTSLSTLLGSSFYSSSFMSCQISTNCSLPSCDFYRISIFWFYCGGHLVRHFVCFNGKQMRDPHLTSHSIKLPSCDNHLGILSDLVAILDAILYFLTLVVR